MPCNTLEYSKPQKTRQGKQSTGKAVAPANDSAGKENENYVKEIEN
jgi:hypothetical protein